MCIQKTSPLCTAFDVKEYNYTYYDCFLAGDEYSVMNTTGDDPSYVHFKLESFPGTLAHNFYIFFVFRNLD